MDRIDAMRVFVAALDEGSLAGAGRRLRKSPTAVSRAIALLESHVGAELLHRTTRTLRLSEAGERYAAACRRILTDLAEADLLAAGEAAAPRGLLTLTGPAFSGRQVLRPIIDDFLDQYPAVRATLLLLDRQVSLVEEGIDIALRIAHLSESSLVAIRVGQVSRVVCASPGYLKGKPKIMVPADMLQHAQIEPVLLVAVAAASAMDKLRHQSARRKVGCAADHWVDVLEGDSGHVMRVQGAQRPKIGRHRPRIADAVEIGREIGSIEMDTRLVGHGHSSATKRFCLARWCAGREPSSLRPGYRVVFGTGRS